MIGKASRIAIALWLGMSSCGSAPKTTRISDLEERLTRLEAENYVLKKDMETLQIQLARAMAEKGTATTAETDLASGGTGETQVPADATTMKFETNQHDFGVIKDKDQVTHIYRFTNTGNQPLTIRDVKASCGCTIPKWPKKPIPPGEQGEIKVLFNAAGKRGPQHKVVTVTANTDPANTRLYLQAYIEQ